MIKDCDIECDASFLKYQLYLMTWSKNHIQSQTQS